MFDRFRLSWLPCQVRTPARRPRARLAVETLEDRSVPTAVPAPPGLVSWWTGDGDARDLVGPNAGTLNNGVTFALGEVASGFGFAAPDYVSATTAGLPTGNSDRSLELWVRINAFGSGEAFFAGYGSFGSFTTTYQLGADAGRRLFFSQWGQAINGPAMQAGQWYHIAVTNVGNSITLYLNGSAVAGGSLPMATPQNAPFYIGRIPGALGETRQLNGMVDEVAVYNRALSSNEIQNIYLAGPDGKLKDYIVAGYPTVVEGAAGSTSTAPFTIRREGNLTGSAVVQWTTADGTALAGTDFVAASGQVTFQDGESQKVVQVIVNGDNASESNETFNLVLSTTAPGFEVRAGQATIRDDDLGVSVDDATADEGSQQIGSLGALVSQSANGAMDRTTALAFGPDGNLYVASQNTDQVLRFHGTTGAFLGTFINAGSGGLDDPFMQGLQFRPDGKLYVLSRTTAQVLRFDATTGAFLDVFIPSNSGGLLGAKGMTFGPDGSWYVSSGDNNQVLRYNGVTGQFLGVFVPAGSGGLSNPRPLVFGPDGSLYVSSSGSNSILRYNGQTGAFIDAFVPVGSGGLVAPAELLFHGGSLYVASQNTSAVLRYDATTGAFLGAAVPASLGGLNAPIGLLFDLDDNLLVGSSAEILRYGPASQAAVTVRLNIPSATPVTVNYATANGAALAGSDYAAASGTLTFAPGETVKTVVVRTLDDARSEPTETFTINLSSATGTVITDAQAVATISDNEPPLLQVASVAVNGGAAQRSRVTELTVTFTGLATLPANPADAFRLSRTGPTGPTGDVTLSVDLSASTATQTVARLTFGGSLTDSGSLIDGTYTLTVLGSQVAGPDSAPLDGDADGTAGGDATTQLYRLFGDANGDRAVTAGDFNLFRQFLGTSDPIFDANGDGIVTAGDFNAFRANLGAGL